MDGVLLVDKPSGPTSFDAVRRARRASGTRRVGHAGTLDPLASGLLVVCLGTHTRLVPYLMDGAKLYEARISLGAATDTDDAEGVEIRRAPVPALSRETAENALAGFVGRIQQRPPAYSALKKNGVPAYERARRGEELDLAPREIEIRRIDLVEVADDSLLLRVLCGKGTYIRSLARDLAEKLGTAGHINALRRLASSGFRAEDALPLDSLEEAAASGELERRLLEGAACLPDMGRLILDDAEVQAISCGRSIELREGEALPSGSLDTGRLALMTREGELFAVGRIEGERVVCDRGFPR